MKGSSKNNIWKVYKHIPLVGWQYAETFEGNWDQATQRASQILDSDELAFEVKYAPILSTDFTYLPQWLD